MPYKFKLREDMPPGFIENSRCPELPAAHEYLKQLEGKEYKTIEEFQKELSGFGEYLEQKKIPIGMDRDVREGIFIFEGNLVGTHNDGISSECHFGKLEEIVSTEEKA